MFKRKIFFDAPETGGSGAAAIQVPTNDNQEVIDTPQVDTGTTDTQTSTQPEVFDPTQLNFGTDEGTSEFQFLADEGIDISSENFTRTVDKLRSLGVTDPQVIGNFARELAAQQKETPLNPEEVKRNLMANLTPDELRNYNKISNVVKNAFLDDPELTKDYPNLMSEPQVVKALNKIINYVNGGANPNPRPGTVVKSTSSISFEKATQMAEEEITKAIQKNGSLELSTKQEIINKIARHLSPDKVNDFKIKYNV